MGKYIVDEIERGDNMNAQEKYAKYKKARTPKFVSSEKYKWGAICNAKGLSERAKFAWFMDGILSCEDQLEKERVEV